MLRRTLKLAVLAVWLESGAARAEPPPADHAGSGPAPEAAPAPPVPDKLAWRDTWLVWDNAMTAQTLGIGQSYQSANPRYETSLSLRPRYYFHDVEGEWAYLAGRLDVVRELTNSDRTTNRGETLLSDATLLAGYRRTLASQGAYRTTLIVSAPVLTLPTSKFSHDNGTILGLGAGVRLNQTVPLAGPRWPVFQTLTLSAFAGYTHTITRAVTPTNPDLRRVRLDPEGRTVPGDQLTGAAFPAHELDLAGRLIADITDRLALFLEVSYRPTWKYAFGDLCVNIATGCAVAARPANPSTYVVVTSFEVALFYDVVKELSLGLGYVNVETQPGLDGQRRNLFYSPGSQFSLSLVAHLDEIYLRAAGRPSAEATAGPRLRP